MDAEGFLREAETLQQTLVQERRCLHQNAEVGFALEHTVAFVKEELTAIGLTPTPCGKAGLVAHVGGKQTGKVFLLRADMDALPIR